MSAFSIFDPRKTPSVDSFHYEHYGEDSLGVLLDQYGVNKTALTLDGEEYEKKALITTEVCAEWMTFCHYLSKQPKEDMASQLNNFVTTEMLKTMFPNLNMLANVCMTIPVGTASVERSFSQMKMIKTHLRNRLGEKSLSYLMKIGIESPKKLSDIDLETIIGAWIRKPRKIVIGQSQNLLILDEGL